MIVMVVDSLLDQLIFIELTFAYTTITTTTALIKLMIKTTTQ